MHEKINFHVNIIDVEISIQMHCKGIFGLQKMTWK